VRAPVGALNRADQVYALGRGLAALEARNVDADFLHYLMQRWRVVLQRVGQGTTFDAITAKHLSQLVVPVPIDPEEQQLIASILRAIDEAIKRTRTTLEKARKLRKGVIQNFIESGIGKVSSADAPSGFLRKGWRLEQTKHLLVGDPKNGISPEAAFQPPGYPTFSIAAVRLGKINLSSGKHLKYVKISEAKAKEFAVRRGDLLIVRGNANPGLVGLCGMIADHPDKCVYPDILKRVVFRNDEQGCSPAYVRIVWNHPVVHNQVLKRAKTSNGTLKINSKDVKQIVLPVPPKDEQEAFVNLVDKLEVQLSSLEVEITALQKLKKGLMQDLLTGKVRVKQLATAGSETG